MKNRLRYLCGLIMCIVQYHAALARSENYSSTPTSTIDTAFIFEFE